MTQDRPRTTTGKIDRQALKSLKFDQEPPDVGQATDLDPLEVALVAIWSEVLGVPVHGSLADFFDLGGNSLSVMSLFTAIEIPLRIRDELLRAVAREWVSESSHG